MSYTHKIVVLVKEVKGDCAAGHKVGDVAEVEGLRVKGYICPTAFNAIYPYIFAMRFGVELPWAEDKKVLVCCPDPKSMVMFELKSERARKPHIH